MLEDDGAVLTGSLAAASLALADAKADCFNTEGGFQRVADVSLGRPGSRKV